MKLLAILIMLAALFLLYRIAYPKQADTKKGDTPPKEPKQEKPATDVMGKSRFVLPDRSKPLQTPATLSETETTSEKPVIFAAETEENLRRLSRPKSWTRFLQTSRIPKL